MQLEVAKANQNARQNTYEYNGTIFNVVPNFKLEYCYNQLDYSRFNNKYGYNRGCTAVAMACSYSIRNNTPLSPNDVFWCAQGTIWEYAMRYTDTSNKCYSGGTYNQTQALGAIYDCVTNGLPIIVGVNGSGSDHVVTVVGIREGAQRNTLTIDDILIVDPFGGNICSLNAYESIDCSWGLRIPIE